MKNIIGLTIGTVLKSIDVENMPFALNKFYKITNGDCVCSLEVGGYSDIELTYNDLDKYFKKIVTLEDIENIEYKAFILKETYIQEEIMSSESNEKELSYDLLIENVIHFLVNDEVFKGDEIELRFICDNIDVTSVDKCVCCGKILLPDDEAYEDQLRDGATLCDNCSVFNEDTNMYQCSVKKDTIEKITGLKFSEYLNDVHENIEEFNYWLNRNNLFFSINNKESKKIFIRFLNEYTQWNLCDVCGLIESSDELAWVTINDFIGEELKAAVFACEKLNVESLCDVCMGSIENRTKLSLSEVVVRIKENKMIYREGDLVVLSNVNFEDKKFSNKTLVDYVVSIDENKKTYKLEKHGDIEFIEEDFYDAANEAYIEEYTSFIATNHPELNNEVSELIEDSFEGIPDIEEVFTSFEHKKEFIKYLKLKNLPYERFLTPKFKVGDSFSIHFEYYMEKEFTNHNISFIDTSFTEADEIIYWDDSCVYILESELEKQKELLTKNVNKSENVITHEDYEDYEDEEEIVY